jgi:hypothetical protein
VKLSGPSTASSHQKEQFCPSARCEDGAVLLGIVGADGRVGYVTPRMTVDAEFVREARSGRTPETRFRFAQPCIEGRCAQWTGSRCGLIDQALESPEAAGTTEWAQGTLPECVIRSSCRWFGQAGAKACAVCPLVVHTLTAL